MKPLMVGYQGIEQARYGLQSQLVRLVASATLFLLYHLANGQDKSSFPSSQVWIDYNTKTAVSERLDYRAAYGWRTIFPHNWSRIWVRQYVSYDWHRLILKKAHFKERFDFGIDLFYTDNFNVSNAFEITPFQAYSLILPNMDKMVLRHYLKLEERFEYDTENLNRKFGLRLSYQVSGALNFKGNTMAFAKGFFVPLSAKFFWNLIGTRQFNDKIRITPGVGYSFTSKWKAALLFGYNYSRIGENEKFESNDIIYRLQINHLLDSKPNF